MLVSLRYVADVFNRAELLYCNYKDFFQNCEGSAKLPTDVNIRLSY